MTRGPAPFSWAPSQYWDGDDGSWSSFALRVGTPQQTVRVFPSTAGQATFVVGPLGCQATDNYQAFPNCTQTRGGLFDTSKSLSWNSLGNYTLSLETNLGYNETAAYGLESIALGFSDANGGPTFQNQTVSDISTTDYYVGLFGIGNQPTNFTTQSNPQPSFLTTLRTKNLIPSLSWAYTAGAKYRLKGVFGSLTFGGYDLSRLVPNNVSFSLAPDISRGPVILAICPEKVLLVGPANSGMCVDLVVGLQSITARMANGSTKSLLPSPILTFIDSTLPYIYLPPEACTLFEDEFGLVYNTTTGQYLINDTQHQSLLAKNANFTFQIGDSTTGGPTVDIVLPYASFDLQGEYPLLYDTSRYFPLQPGNETTYLLGRTFLQEAYVITNYEYSNFSVSQCKFEDGLPEKIVAIPSANNASTSPLSRRAVVGISIGATALLILIILVITLAVRRRLRKPPKRLSSDSTKPLKGQEIPKVFPIQEMGHGSLYGVPRELADSGKAELMDDKSPSGSDKEILELPQSAPPVYYELLADTASWGKLKTHEQRPSIASSAKSKTEIYVSTRILTQSRTSIERSSTPLVETIITSGPSPRSKFPSRPKPLSFSPSSCPTALAPDLMRPLPPTPISESPQISPVTPYSQRSQRLRRLPVRAPPNSTSTSGTFENVSPTSPEDQSTDTLIGSEPGNLCASPVGLEIVIPPGESEPEESSVSSIDIAEGRVPGDFF